MANTKFVQLTGPFTKGEELFSRLDNGESFCHLSQFGILARPEHGIYLNGHLCFIGKTGILQYDNVEITSLYFYQDEPATTKIDCVVN